MLSFGNKFSFKLFCLLTLSVVEASSFLDLPEKPMVVIIASYNNIKWVDANLTSVFTQDYSNYRIIYVDDASSDGTADLVERLVTQRGQESRFTLIRNTIRKGGLCNLYNAVCSCSDEEIVVNVDGDDWLASNSVLKTLNEVYSTRNVWLTHGTMIEYPGYVIGWSMPISKKIVRKNAFRTYRCPSHLKTFYTWLFKKIDVEDLKHQGEFFPMTWDQAMMFPMMEMAGNRHAFIPEVLYVYNMANPISDGKMNPQLLNDLERVIRSKPSYARLPRSPCP